MGTPYLNPWPQPVTLALVRLALVGAAGANSQLPLPASGARTQQACDFTGNHHFAFLHHFGPMERYIFEPADDFSFNILFIISVCQEQREYIRA